MDGFRVTYMALSADFPPAEKRYKTGDLADLYADLCKRHQLETCELHGEEGANFITEGLNRVELQRNRLRITEHVQRDFQLANKSFTDIVGAIMNRFNIQLLGMPKILFRGLWSLPKGQDAQEAIRHSAVGLNDDQFGLLKGYEVDSVGIKVNGSAKGGHFGLEIMPYWQDDTQLFIELDTHIHQVFQSPTVLEQTMQERYEYLTGDVIDFAKSFMPH